MAPEDRAAMSGFPWRNALLGGGFAAFTYTVLPFFSPDTLGDGATILLMGVILGLAAGVAYRLGPPVVPVVAVVAALTVAIRFSITGTPVVLAVSAGVIVGAELWAIPTWLRRSGAGSLTRIPDVFIVAMIGLVVAFAASVVAALVAVATAPPGAELVGDGFLQVALAWFVDDVFGLVVVMPAVLLMPPPHHWTLRRAPEFLLAAAFSVMSTVYVFYLVDPAAPGYFGWPYLILLGPIWAAIRLGAAASSVIVAFSFWLGVVATVGGNGAFTRSAPEPHDQLFTVELFVTTMGVAILALAVLRDAQRRALVEAESSARLLRDIVDATDTIIFAKDYREREAGRYIVVNRAWSRLRRRSREDAVGSTDLELYPADVADDYRAVDRQVLDSNTSIESQTEETGPDGRTHQFALSKFPLRDDAGRPWGVGGIATDISEVVEAQEREAHQADLLTAVFEFSPTPAVRLLVSGEHRGESRVEVVSANAAMCRMMGAEPGSFHDCDLLVQIHPDDRDAAAGALSRAASPVQGRPTAREQAEVRLRTLDGRTIWALLSAGSVAGAAATAGATELVVQLEDFTARREAEQALAAQALRDAVTGLPNRRALAERLEASLARLRRRPGAVTVFFCDLDRFKDVNDSLGHQAGDRMLVAVAGRLRSALRPEDTLARLGGDEFVAFTEGAMTAEDELAIAQRMMDRLGVPWSHDHAQFTPAMSVGVASTSDPMTTPDELLRRADVAMYRAKESGRNQVARYDKAIDDRVQQAVAVQHDLRVAIDTDTLIVHHQPLVDLRSGAVTCTEALVRLPALNGSLVPPGMFIPEAETTGLIVPMGAWVLDRALEDVVRWRAAGHEMCVSVNVSPAQLSEGFAEHVLERVASLGADPSWLSLEVTEGALIREPVRTGRELTALNRAGVRVALDDFGTGYSSLSWLSQLPVSTVKIDRSFVADLGLDDRKSSIVRAIIEVSHDLGFDVVAEGVETDHQRDWLLAAGCDRGQGYLFGHPVPAAQVQLD